MKESVVRDLIGSNLVRLIHGGLQGIYTDAFSGRILKTEGHYAVQSPVVISQLAMSPASQVLSFLMMETDSMLRLGKRMLPDRPKEEALKLVISANAEILNFVSSRIAWLLSKLENVPNTEISPSHGGQFLRDPGLSHPGRRGGLFRIRLRAPEPGFPVRVLHPEHFMIGLGVGAATACILSGTRMSGRDTDG